MEDRSVENVDMKEPTEPEPDSLKKASAGPEVAAPKKKKGSLKPVVIHPGADDGITFADRLGSHPVVNTAIKLEHGVDDYRPAWIPDKRPSIINSRNLNDLFIGPPKDEDCLPPTWAPAPPQANDPDAWRIARQLLVVFIPIEAIPSTPRFHVTDQRGVIGTAFYFFNKAIASAKIGTFSNDGSLHRFTNNHGQSLPKMEVFAEVVVRESISLLKRFMSSHYMQYSTVEINENGEKIYGFSKTGIERAVADVRFREKILARKNIVGVRFKVVVYDPSLDAGRAIQKREFRNQVLTGEFSPAEVVGREEAFAEERKKKKTERDKALKEAHRAKKKAGEDPDADAIEPEAAHAEQAQEQPIAGADPREEERKAKIDKLFIEAEQARVRGDDDEVEKIMKLIEKENAAAQRGPSRQDMLAHNIVRAKQLGLTFEAAAFNVRHPSMLLRIKDQQDRFSTVTQMGSSSSKRVNNRELRTLSDQQKKEYASQTRGPDAAVVSVKRMRDILGVIGALLNIPSEKASASDSSATRELRQRLYFRMNEMMNENIDLGDKDHYYHPTKWLTFQNMNDGWNLAGVACDEQVNHANYRSDSGELQFPIPCLVWRLAPEKGFKAKVLSNQPPFWEFDPLFEKLSEIERKYEHDARQRQMESQKPKTEEYTAKTHKLIDNIPETMLSVEKKKQLKEAEDRNFAKFRQSSYYKDQQTYEKKYPAAAVVVDNSKINSLLLPGASDAADRAEKERHAVLVRDIIADEVEKAEQLETRVLEACKKAPEEEGSLMRSFRKHQFKVYSSLMRPDADKHYPNNPYVLSIFQFYKFLCYSIYLLFLLVCASGSEAG